MNQCIRCGALLRMLSLVLLAGALPSMAVAQTEQITWSVIGTGGVIGASDGNAFFAATLGQPIIGPTAQGVLMAYQGFWLPLEGVSSVGNDATDALAGSAFRLRNYPNPFSSSTTISYRLDSRGHVRVGIVDLFGNDVVTLVDDDQTSGEQRIQWDGMNARGMKAEAGVYLCVLSVSESGSGPDATRVEKRKLLLVR